MYIYRRITKEAEDRMIRQSERASTAAAAATAGADFPGCCTNPPRSSTNSLSVYCVLMAFQTTTALFRSAWPDFVTQTEIHG